MPPSPVAVVPPSAAPGRGSAFVTVTAALSLGLGALGLASGLLQALMLAVLPAPALLAPFEQGGMPLPPVLHALLVHLPMLNLAATAVSGVLMLLAWGLLRRREWGRRGFIALLVLAALANFALPVWLPGLATPVAGLDDPLLARLRQAVRLAFWLAALAVAGIHAWIVWKLGQPAIRAEFGRQA